MVRKLSDSYSSSDVTSINLTHLLARLENNLLSPSADLKLLRRSPYHRARVGANIEYARTLILKLELTLPNIKIQSRKHALQTDLAQKRQQIKTLKTHLDEIAAAAAETDPDTQTFSSDNEDDLLPTPNDSTPDTTSPPPTRGADQASTRHEEVEDERKGEESEAEETTQERRNDEQVVDKPPSPSPTQPREPSPSNTFRGRHPHHHRYPSSSSATTPTATTTGTSLPTATTTTIRPLFPNRPTPTTSSTPSAQTALSQNEAEQDTLTTSLLALATQLKTSTQNLHTSLESEKSIIERAAEGLDQSTTGMEAAGKRLGALRRMAEGRGWWGRALMYVWIFGLWVVAVLIVFVGPKLRF
ncbi:hypothetical protein BDBG_00929 [Blastomyces gilchristii SLH14081]|uniref:Synaptobrevin n=1 Tax=Blastomyces gilchristii (strain SLH14081) TaxID=559298 RepID=A0A179U943_BLAGS|nr:uncharacterized protein BDBG_00929 [Blastomyces gilchristii SLH14081]OAT04360.1 hypothetical protein BDBG_00929 [Blastomyces gilchristii SLH14081]